MSKVQQRRLYNLSHEGRRGQTFERGLGQQYDAERRRIDLIERFAKINRISPSSPESTGIRPAAKERG